MTADNSNGTNGFSDSKEATLAAKKLDLEQKYVQLLEERIADLESKLDRTKKIAKDENKKDQKNGEKAKDKQSRIRYVVAKIDRNTGNWTDTVVNETEDPDEDKGDVAFTFRKRLSLSEKGDMVCEADIQSKKLKTLLKETIGDDYPGQSWGGDVVNVRSPFTPIIHFWSALQSATEHDPSDNEETRQARDDLAGLLELVKGSSTNLESYFKTRESYQSAGITTFDTMWSLFVPGQLVFAKPFLGTPQVFVVEAPPYNWDTSIENPSRLTANCWCYDWNGKHLVKVYFEVEFEQFRGTKPVSELPCYPLDYYQAEEGPYRTKKDLTEMLIARGKKFYKIARTPKGAKQMYRHDGTALPERQGGVGGKASTDKSLSAIELFLSRMTHRSASREGREDQRTAVKANERYIVDFDAFFTYASPELALGQLNPYHVDDKETADPRGTRNAKAIENGVQELLSDRHYMLLPPRLLGYSTRGKFWGQFRVDGTQEVGKPSSDEFDNKLQLEDHYKQMIKALVESHEGEKRSTSDRSQVKDIAVDKGRGLVILLHGPPGVGKTLTAETIAEASGKPLFIVSVADIGLDASKAEKNLEQLFSLAGTWEAVLLVDEADVFLESRNDMDPNRNALVSVLLRVLEYYQGIIILTTNRITSLDVAVQSRIHLAIRYEDLSKKNKEDIFKIFLDQLEPSTIKDRAAIDDWIKEYGSESKFNGRQIRNVVTSALALARSSAKQNAGDDRLTRDHLKTVINITKEFQEQLEDITKTARGANEVRRFK